MTVRSLDKRHGPHCFLAHEPGRKQIAEHLREHVGEERCALVAFLDFMQWQVQAV